jgi:hypothetical protein
MCCQFFSYCNAWTYLVVSTLVAYFSSVRIGLVFLLPFYFFYFSLPFYFFYFSYTIQFNSKFTIIVSVLLVCSFFMYLQLHLYYLGLVFMFSFLSPLFLLLSTYFSEVRDLVLIKFCSLFLCNIYSLNF